MAQIGYALASEDWGPNELVRLARRAEEAGFEYALVSDHFHPWIDAQGESPFVWADTVDHARLYALPDDEPPPVVVAAELAGRLGDGLVNTAPDPDVVQTFERAGGKGKPRYGMIHVCYGQDERETLKTAHRLWPNLAIEGELTRELARPAFFEDAAAMVSEEDLAARVPCGPDPERHLEAIRKYEEAGFDHVFVHQIGPDQEDFFRFYRDQILPRA